MKGSPGKISPYATNEAGLIKSPKAKPAQPNASRIQGNDLRVRGGGKKK